jgi:hypothetical protein
MTKDAGSRPHPYTILFSLSEPPKGVYRLDVSVILSRSRVPALRVELNGKSGVFYFHRKVSYYPGDFGADSPIYGGDREQFELPTRLFKLGENKLVLTALDDPKDGEGESWLAYDALQLIQNPAGKPADRPQVSVEPTIFYTHQGGGLAELATITDTQNIPTNNQ